MSDVILPKEFERRLNEASKATARDGVKKKVFVGLPSMLDMNVALVTRLFAFAQSKEVEPWFHFLSENRHHDHARNRLGQMFMESPCEFLYMIDSDVAPHPDSLGMALLNKDIVSGLVFCWINNELMPSLWERAECEQCRVLKIWMEQGKNHDEREYRISQDEKIMFRWDPFLQLWSQWANRDGFLKDRSCRCRGTGFDPFVFKGHRNVFGEDAVLTEIDSCGAANIMIARRVMEQVPFPWFSFLYREDRSMMLTEDHYFCWKAKEMGFRIWGDPKLASSHFKMVDLSAINNVINKGYCLGKQIGAQSQDVIVPA